MLVARSNRRSRHACSDVTACNLAANFCEIGAPVMTATDPTAFRACLEKAFVSDGPVIVEALVDSREYDGVVLHKDKP